MPKFLDILPFSMPNVTVLDFGHFDVLNSNLMTQLTLSFPNIVSLNLLRAINPQGDREILELNNAIFNEFAFPKIRRIVLDDLCCCEYSRKYLVDSNLRTFFKWDRRLEYISLSLGSYRIGGILNASFANTLTALDIIQNVMLLEDFSTVGRLEGLVTLFIPCDGGTGEDIMHLKSLRSLEHLHLYCNTDDEIITDEEYAEFFKLPGDNPGHFFPSKLRYLQIERTGGFGRLAIDALTTSCPNMESLSVTCSSTIDGEFLKCISRRLSKIKFLDISCLPKESYYSLDLLKDHDLAYLQYLRLLYAKIKRPLFAKLIRHRPHLIIEGPEPRQILTLVTKYGGSVSGKRPSDFDWNSLQNDFLEIPGFCCISGSRVY
ncbi:hypothetical protein AB6A40_007083 [Gnathostoma spinigerum]|uniref:Uncharacterized protein n=1 Tax=Gnathostoma spinigerum TaxID=75299 RepID=A0ABD6ESU7_9BILA